MAHNIHLPASRAALKAELQSPRSLARQQHRCHKAAAAAPAAVTSAVRNATTTTAAAGRHNIQPQAPVTPASSQQHQWKQPVVLQWQQASPVRPTARSPSSNLAHLLQLLRSRGAAAHPALLTAAIKATSSWQQAAAVFTEHSHGFNHIHTAAFISHLPKVLSGHLSTLTPLQQSDVRLLLQDVSQLAEELLHDCSGRELANMAHGFASLGFYNRRLMQLLLCRCDLAKLKPQELANLTWAVAKLGHDMQEGWVQQVLDLSMMYMQQQGSAAVAGVQPGFSSTDRTGFKPQEICNIAWGLAVMQRRCLLHSAPPLRHGCTVVDAAWKAQLCCAVAAQVRQCSAADVSMCLWALAVLGFRGVQQPWLDLLLLRATELVGVMQGRHIAVLLWATSRLTRQQQQHTATAAGGLCPSNRYPGSNSSSSGLQRFSTACFPAVQQLVLQELKDAQQQQQHKRGQLQLVCVLLLSCAHLGLQPPAAAMADMLAAAAQHLQAWTVQQKQQQQQQQQQHVPSGDGIQSSSTDIWHHWSNVPGSQQQHQQPGVTVHDVGTLLYGLARVSFRPGQRFMAAATAAAATAICNQCLMPAAARRREQQQQQSVLPGTIGATGVRVQGKELAMLVWSLAKLHCRPSNRVLWLVRVAAVEQLDTFSSRDVALVLWALGQMHDAPQFKWVRRMLRHFLARLDDSVHTAPDICQVLNALPCLPSTGAKNLHCIMLEELDDLLPQLAAAAAMRFDDCGARELVGMLQGFARLGYWPGCDWQQQHWQHCERLQGTGVSFSAREQQILEHSRTTLARLGEQHGRASRLDVAAATGQLQQPIVGSAEYNRNRQLAAYSK